MHPNKPFLYAFFLVAVGILAACALPGMSGDPCTQPQLGDEVKKVSDLMRAFDDTNRVIANTPRSQLNDGIIQLQSIKRQAEDLDVPVCLVALKTYEVAHMNAMIDTLISFMGGANATIVNQGLAKAQAQHVKYDEELARVLGVAYNPSPSVVPIGTTDGEGL